MASSTLQKILRNQTQSTSKFLPYFRKPLPPLPPHSRTQIPQIFNSSDPVPNHPETDYVKSDSSCYPHIYPSFSLGFFLNPTSPSILIRSEPDGEATQDESNVIRADSTKKKRKRKMNKHKLKKLRKRLRKKT